jgi:hypothetical protein
MNLIIRQCPDCGLWLPEGDLADPCPHCIQRMLALKSAFPYPNLTEEPDRENF